MPAIDLVQVPLWASNDPYFWEVDNIPLQSLIARQTAINGAVENILSQLRDAIGTQNTIGNRLNQSINADGSLKGDAIDEALHDIGSHTDSDDYVRMTVAQSAKLDLIADEAKDISLEVPNGEGSTVLFDDGVIEFADSESITFSIEAPNIVKANMAFPAEAAHQHYYGQIPVPSDLIDPDYINYKVSSGDVEFVEGSLRIYINGVRIFESPSEVYVPGALITDPWTLMSFSSEPTEGTFTLSSAISEDDIIVIDFDLALVE